MENMSEISGLFGLKISYDYVFCLCWVHKGAVLAITKEPLLQLPGPKIGFLIIASDLKRSWEMIYWSQRSSHLSGDINDYK